MTEKPPIYHELLHSPTETFIWVPKEPRVMVVGKVTENSPVRPNHLHVIARDDQRKVVLGCYIMEMRAPEVEDAVEIVAASINYKGSLKPRTYMEYRVPNAIHADGWIYFEAHEVVFR